MDRYGIHGWLGQGLMGYFGGLGSYGGLGSCARLGGILGSWDGLGL